MTLASVNVPWLSAVVVLWATSVPVGLRTCIVTGRFGAAPAPETLSQSPYWYLSLSVFTVRSAWAAGATASMSIRARIVVIILVGLFIFFSPQKIFGVVVNLSHHCVGYGLLF
jgi:hypothetical protein